MDDKFITQPCLQLTLYAMPKELSLDIFLYIQKTHAGLGSQLGDGSIINTGSENEAFLPRVTGQLIYL